MAGKKVGSRDWESWLEEFRTAAQAWESLVPRSPPVRVVDGTIYLVRGPAGTKKELTALGWVFAKDGARSVHPTPNRKSALAKASGRLLKACQALPNLDGVLTEEFAAPLQHALGDLRLHFDGRPDPATKQQLEAVRAVKARLMDIHRASAEEQAAAARIAQQQADERRHAKLVAEELSRLQPPAAKSPTAAEVALQEPRAQQLRVADTAFGRDALRLLADTHAKAAGSRRELSAFNGCGGMRWNKTSRAKQRGKNYDAARRALKDMVDWDLVERVGSGASKRGVFRITAAGLKVLDELSGGTSSRRTPG